ncbi:MAG: DUF1080 domain-containing protein [Verrucomicrobiae bacterium]|jgi:hypothetical protein|nr:DUF1080 domain-containing protein [Verrucomicrobiae bacterium]
MKHTALLLLLTSLASVSTGAEWKTLFDGRTLDGWKPTSDANWRVENGAIVVDSGQRGFLIHEDTYDNYELTVEFKAAKGANSGVFLNTKHGKLNLTEDCYELNIAPPDNPFPTGSLVARVKVGGAGESDAWRRFDVRVVGGHVTVKLDGKQVVDYRAKTPASGNLLGLQLNEGRVAFRNIRARKLGKTGD